MNEPKPAKRVRFVLKLDVPAILEHRIEGALLRFVRSLPIERPRVSLSRGEYLDAPNIDVQRLAKRRDLTPKL